MNPIKDSIRHKMNNYNKVVFICLYYYNYFFILNINYIYIKNTTFKSIINNKLYSTSTTINSVTLSSTHIENKSLSGRLFMELSKIYPNKDGKYRNLSK